MPCKSDDPDFNTIDPLTDPDFAFPLFMIPPLATPFILFPECTSRSPDDLVLAMPVLTFIVPLLCRESLL